MTPCIFATDLHGSPGRYRALAEAIARERPAAVFLGGDLLPSGWLSASQAELGDGEFVGGFLFALFGELRRQLGGAYPRVLLILGNDDVAAVVPNVTDGETAGLWEHLHQRRTGLGGFTVVGYACVPPTPFLLKDWERYDVSRFTDPGSFGPEEGYHSVPFSASEVCHGTISRDLTTLLGKEDLGRTVLLLHAPPHGTCLDRAALDGKMVDHVPLDVHIGSVTIRRLIEARQPWLTLHGHVHESTRLTGSFVDRIGRTTMLQGAHDGPELALIRFDLEAPEHATRELLK
jgi:Icc-related predicted phosphoesterase